MKAKLLLVMLSIYLGSSAAVNTTDQPKYIQLLGVDFVGPSYTSVFRHFANDKKSPEVDSPNLVTKFTQEACQYVDTNERLKNNKVTL
jgi:hypothetical protein